MKSVMSTIETGQLCDLASRYLRNQLIPTALCFQNQFDYFPHRARAHKINIRSSIIFGARGN